jgi:hypothetical protein
MPFIANSGVEIFALQKLSGAVFIFVNPAGGEEFYGVENVLQINGCFFVVGVGKLLLPGLRLS